MKRRNFIKAGLFVPPVVTSLYAAPSFARPGSVAATPGKKPIQLLRRNTEINQKYHNAIRVSRSFDSPLSDKDWKVNDWQNTKTENGSSLEHHLQLIWRRLREFFLESRWNEIKNGDSSK